MRTANPLKDFWEHMSNQEEWYESRPVCDQCGEHIQDEYYYLINGEIFCEDCLDWHKKYID